MRSEEHTSELQSRSDLVCRLLLEKKKNGLGFLLQALFFFFNDTATTEIYTLSLHDALPISFSLEILSVDGHVKRGKYVTAHLHLNVTYLMEADPVQEIRCKPDENSAVGWIPVEQIAEKSTEPWFVERVYGKLCEKVKRDFCEV